MQDVRADADGKARRDLLSRRMHGWKVGHHRGGLHPSVLLLIKQSVISIHAIESIAQPMNLVVVVVDAAIHVRHALDVGLSIGSEPSRQGAQCIDAILDTGISYHISIVPSTSIQPRTLATSRPAVRLAFRQSPQSVEYDDGHVGIDAARLGSRTFLRHCVHQSGRSRPGCYDSVPLGPQLDSVHLSKA